jgi:hypothetical protein
MAAGSVALPTDTSSNPRCHAVVDEYMSKKKAEAQPVRKSPTLIGSWLRCDPTSGPLTKDMDQTEQERVVVR